MCIRDRKYISHYGVNAPAGPVETVRDDGGNDLFKDFDGEVRILDRANPEHLKWYCTGHTPEEHAKMILDYAPSHTGIGNFPLPRLWKRATNDLK